MKIKTAALVAALACCREASGFSSIASTSRHPTSSVESFTALTAKSRKARREEKKGTGRPKGFYDAIEDAQGGSDKKKNASGDGGPKLKSKVDEEPRGPPSPEDERAAYLSEAERQIAQRPEVSTMVYDEETGYEVVIQGRSVMDVITRKAVKLSDLGPEYRLAQMFPGVPPDVRAKYRMDLTTITVPEMVEKLKEACSVKLEDGTRDIPPHPSVANKAIDFVLANRDLLGFKMKRLLVRLEMRAKSQFNRDEAREMSKLVKNFYTIENHISAPFRQILQNAEGRIGPNFGNLDLRSFCQGDLYDRIGDYLVLKGMVAHWEQKVVDADFLERPSTSELPYIEVLARGDPKRYLPDPPILFTLKECTQVCAMAQQMCKAFVDDEELYSDFPPEIVFLEDALTIRGGTALRQYMIDDFCPARGITPAGLREGMRRLYIQLESMDIDPYGDLTNKIQDLSHAMAVGTDEMKEPYAEYLANPDPNGPGSFQTYTFDFPQNSLVRFLDSMYDGGSGMSDDGPEDEEDKVYTQNSGFDFGALFGMESNGPAQTISSKSLRAEPDRRNSDAYVTPDERAAGRPHNLGWLNLLDDEKGESVRLGQVKPGRIIPDDE